MRAHKKRVTICGCNVEGEKASALQFRAKSSTDRRGLDAKFDRSPRLLKTRLAQCRICEKRLLAVGGSGEGPHLLWGQFHHLAVSADV